MRRHPSHFRRNPQDALIAAIDKAIEAYENDEIDPDYGIHEELHPALYRAFGGAVGPSADWVNYTWRLGGNLYLFEEDVDGEYAVVRRVPADDPDESDQLEDVEILPDLYALREYLSRRANPSRRPPRPPPPPSHTFAPSFTLEASAVQQGLFGAGAFEAKPKEKPRAASVVDERQVDLFGAPLPKKNPRRPSPRSSLPSSAPRRRR